MRGEQQTVGADWLYLGEILYRKWSVYDINWGQRGSAGLDHIDSHKVYGSSYGGPLAFIPNGLLSSRNGIDGAVDDAEEQDEQNCTILILTSSGNRISEIVMKDGMVIAGAGWNDQEQLMLITAEGRLYLYDIWGKSVNELDMIGDTSANIPVLECHFWGNGAVVMTADMKIHVAEGFGHKDSILAGTGTTGSAGDESIRKYKLKTGLAAESDYTSMAIIAPALSRSGLLEVMLGTKDSSILIVDENNVEDQHLQAEILAPVTKMSMAPNGRFLACYRDDGLLTVMSSTLTNKVLDFNTNSMTKPMDMLWCGDDAVVLVWKNTGMIMVGPYGDWLNFPYEGAIHLVPEPDCCRVITSSSCDMLQRVPTATEMIRQIGSTEPAALMFDAMEAFEEGDPKSDENIRSIEATNQLGEAIGTCIEAASAEFDVSRQQSLLKAASYGKAFSSDLSPLEFVNAAKKLRVLNEIRNADVGLPLTSQQYDELTPSVLVGRLTLRKQHFLALKICELLGLRVRDRVLIHWGCEKIKTLAAAGQMADAEIASIIKKKLLAYSESVSFLEVAAAAYHVGRRPLATTVLNFEAHTADQVPLLLSMGEQELALQKAVYSEDTDLICLVLIHLEGGMEDRQAFYKLVHKYPEALNLLKVYYRNRVGKDNALHDLVMFSKNHFEAAKAAIIKSNTSDSFEKTVQHMKEASHLLGQGRDLSFAKSMTDEHVELLDIQKSLEIRANHMDFFGLSVNQTLAKIAELFVEFPHDYGVWEKEAAKLLKKFKVSEKSWWHIKIAAFGRLGAWGHLSKLAGEKKSPVGYAPFARVCIKHEQPMTEVERYIEKIASLEEKFDLFVDTKDWRKAADCARNLRDGEKLTAVYNQCRDPTLQRQVKDLLTKL
jgi:vacuolar protein sorting-associated protein 16